MNTYCIVDKNNIVINKIIWDGKEPYNTHNLYSLILLGENEKCDIGWKLLENNVWQSPKPYQSWNWIDNEWVAPKPKPGGWDWIWDEDSLSWIEVIIPE